MTETIDLTPTWLGVLPALLAAYENGTWRGKTIALEELTRMAKLADKYAAIGKADFEAEKALKMATEGR
jgi:hypothetical protein